MRCPTLSELPPPPPPGKTGWPWAEESPRLPGTMPDPSTLRPFDKLRAAQAQGGAGSGQAVPWPRVSIVTPSYNQGQFIEETIRSVLLQGYPNLEYSIFDGGSTDDSVDIIRRYEPWLAYWISEPDEGQSDAINQGWRRATGEIWAYLNSDDTLAPGAVQAVADAFRAHPEAGIVYGDSMWIGSAGLELGKVSKAACDFRKLLRDGQWRYVCQPASFYRGELVRQVGLLDEALHLSMDYDLLLQLARISEMVYVPRVLAHCRMHPDTKSSRYVTAHWQETSLVRARYGGRYLLKPRLEHLGYRLFYAMPRLVRVLFHQLRNSTIDQVMLAYRRYEM